MSRIIFFDLDDTLYAHNNGLWDAIAERMDRFLREIMDFSPEEASSLRQKYYQTYGTTLRGLQIHHQLDPLKYLHYVHDLPLHRYLKPDPALRVLLTGLPARKYIFTNADQAHARRVLQLLEIADCFDGIIDVEAMDYHCKPEIEAYQCALALTGEPAPRFCTYIDDSARNLAPARELGFTTVLVSPNGEDPSAHYTIATIKELPTALPDLWQPE